MISFLMKEEGDALVLYVFLIISHSLISRLIGLSFPSAAALFCEPRPACGALCRASREDGLSSPNFKFLLCTGMVWYTQT
jgi:hypothetical protein